MLSVFWLHLYFLQNGIQIFTQQLDLEITLWILSLDTSLCILWKVSLWEKQKPQNASNTFCK